MVGTVSTVELSETVPTVPVAETYAVSLLGGQGYKNLFPPLLSPPVWERKGNIPAVTRLIQVKTCVVRTPCV